MRIDGLQYANWSEKIFRQFREGGVDAIHPPVEGHVPRNHASGSFLFRRKYYNHMPARLVRRYVGREIFDSYFKFCVEREPVSKCISHYSMLVNSPDHNRRTKDLSWDDYVSQGKFPFDAKKYTDANGSLMVDQIVPYESLDESMFEIAQKLGFAFERLKAKAKSGFRKEIDVTPEQRRIIYDRFANSLKHTPFYKL